MVGGREGVKHHSENTVHSLYTGSCILTAMKLHASVEYINEEYEGWRMY